VNRLRELHLYPVKGAGGIRVPEWPVGPRGLRHDRSWMLVGADGDFITQRNVPALALVRPQVGGKALAKPWSGGLKVTAPGVPFLSLPLDPFQKPPGAEGGPGEPGNHFPELDVEIWGDRVTAVAPSPEADAWFSRVLATPCRAVFQAPHFRRPTDPRFAPGHEVGFADGFPFLLTSRESLAGLNSRLSEPLPMNRFRPNLVVDVGTAHAEDEWQSFRIGEIHFEVVKPCARCVVTTVDQTTSEKGVEPLRTLATYRLREGKVYFGQNLVHRGAGILREGERILELRG